MTLRERIANQRRRVLNNPFILKWSTDDRVKRAAESVLDIRSRAQEAWRILVDGHALPSIDPALDDSIGQTEEQFTRSRATPRPAGKSNGKSQVPTPDSQGSDDMDESLKERGTIASLGGRDILLKCFQFKAADNARKMGIYPYFRPLDFNDGPEAQINGKRVTMLGSNNYLGLTTHPRVREAARAAIDRFGTSMTGSRLVNGSMRLHEEFEGKLAAWFGKESALVFTTGYQVNLAVCSALLSNRKCVAVVDRNIHASLYDGVRLGQAAGARLVRYRHNDPESLQRALEKLDADEGALVITDGVFSAEGEIAKLDQIVPIVKKHGARLLVDEAHALGVVGPGGKGTPYHFGVADQIDLIGGTFSEIPRKHRRLACRRPKDPRLREAFCAVIHVRRECRPALRCGGHGCIRCDARRDMANRSAPRKLYLHARRVTQNGFRARSYRDGGHSDLHPPGLANHDDVARPPGGLRNLYQSIHYSRRAPEKRYAPNELHGHA